MKMPRRIKRVWKVGVTEWPHPVGYCVWNHKNNMVLETGLETEGHAQAICDRENRLLWRESKTRRRRRRSLKPTPPTLEAKLIEDFRRLEEESDAFYKEHPTPPSEEVKG